MSKNDAGSSPKARKQPARLARAKVKAPDAKDGSGSKAGNAASRDAKAKDQQKPKKKPKTQAEQRAARKKRMTTIIVVIFAVLMALSLMLPSCSTVMANRNAEEAAQQAQQQNDDSASGDSSGSASSTDTSTVAGIDKAYQPMVSDLEAKLKNNDKDLATLLGLGNDYMSWGYHVYALASKDADTSHANDLFAKAEGYYDQYLALNDSPMVRTNRALCQFYSGDTAGAQSALEQLTKTNADFGPAWANLGLVYESQSNTDAAKQAYQKAEETDADDEYGAKSFAESRLKSMESASSSTSSTSSTSGTGSSTATGAAGLSDALGTSL